MLDFDQWWEKNLIEVNLSIFNPGQLEKIKHLTQEAWDEGYTMCLTDWGMSE